MCGGSQFRRKKGQLYTTVTCSILMQPGMLGADRALLPEHLRHRLLAAVTVTHKAPPPLAAPVPGPGWQRANASGLSIYLFLFTQLNEKLRGH